MPIEIEQALDTAAPLRRPAAVRNRKTAKLTAQERMFLTQQLALLLETGTNLHSALVALAKQTQRKQVTQLIEGLASRVEGGGRFAAALAEHPDCFDRTFVNVIAASESGGFVHEALEQLRQIDGQRLQMRRELVNAFTYPAFLLSFSVAVVVFVLVVVFPKFESMFARIANELPATTRMLMTASDLIIDSWMALVVAVAACIAAIWFALQSTPGRQWIDRFKLQCPGIRQLFVELYLVQSLRVLSLSLTNGVNLVEALGACTETVKNQSYRRFLGDVQTKVEQGEGIGSGFSGNPIVPELVQQMIVTGERSGNLAIVTDRVASFYEERLTDRLAMLSRLAEPLMLVVMGGIVGVIIASLVLPIFKLSGSVH